MHSFVFQISTEPIEVDKLVEADDIQMDINLADYVDDFHGNRIEAIESLVKATDGMLQHVGNGQLIYQGGYQKYMENVVSKFKDLASTVNVDSFFNNYKILEVLKNPMNVKFLFASEDSNFWLEQSDVLMTVISNLKEGDSIFIGNVLDYHY